MAPSIHVLMPNNDISFTKFFSYGAIALFAFIVVVPAFKTLFSPLRRVPGPFLARFTRLWEATLLRSQDYALSNIALHKKYGPIVRLAPNRYSINDAEAIKIVLGHRDAMAKSEFYYPFGSPEPNEDNLFSTRSFATHATLRRPITSLYSTTHLLSYEPAVDNCNNLLLRRLSEYAREKKDFDVRELMQFYAFDVIGELTVGARFGLMEDNGDKSGIIPILGEALAYSTYVGLVPGVHWWVGKITGLLGIKPDFVKVQDYAELHLTNRASGKTESPSNGRDFLDILLPLEEAGKVTRKITMTVCLQNIAAGSDTTAISLAAVIGFLAMNPSCLHTLRQELDGATQRGELSEPAAFKETQKLPYLQAVISEALRLHPAVGMPLTRVVGQGGAQLAGQYFPAGTEVGINPWVIHRNTSIFGPDASQFRPQRWLTKDPQERAHLEKNFLSFGTGSRTCLGKNISMMEMSKVIPQIVRKFDFELLEDSKTGEGYTWHTEWFTPQSFKCSVQARST
ncbi:pisatin demethylase [Dothidotthia symphoricarpi CBS 119687]|uniref:Pisatin demethylase n=1 Tax=Dothidotthia symphoricarpi CBS 119687 TaxID=1392245 RepID=A0A6A6AKS4_9PLEO|nr:pisatin demethylase [Dothidotthia symphoricarpi CBS 119687]KAF2131728.1 pisatin demethylase [Dothidotthia symphoricarpi CBS 119687]